MDIENFKRKVTQPRPESVEIANHIIESISQNILDHYEYIDFVNQKTPKQSQDQGMWIQLFNRKKRKQEQSTCYLIDKISDDGFIRKMEIKNEVLPEKVVINHLKVHKQFVPNQCGYYACYNLIQAIHSIKYGRIAPRFEDIASFWSYTVRTQQFLRNYAIRTGQDRDSWPWTDDDILHGDFERTYLKVCLAGKPLFKQTFKNETVDGVSFTVLYSTVYYQYGMLVNEEPERKQLIANIENFRSFVAKDNAQILCAFMMGVTNHWVSMIVQKSVRGVHFFFLDSRIKDFLPLNKDQIAESVHQDNEARKQKGLNPYSDFQLDVYRTGYKDLQDCIALLASCLLGYETIESYITNSRIKVFIFPLIQKLNLTTESFITADIDEICYKSFNIVNEWADSYRHTINNYLYIQIQNMTEQNKQLVRKSQQLVKRCLDHEKKERLWTDKNKKSRLELVNNALMVIKNRL